MTENILDYPEKPCGACGGNTWWYSKTEKDYKGQASWVCGICFPPPTELGNLRMRVIKGNMVLSKRRELIDAMPDDTPEQKAVVLAERKAWGEGIDKIQQIGKQLKQLSTDCLYIENGKKIKPCIHNNDVIECFTCPNDYWVHQELDDLWFNKLGNK